MHRKLLFLISLVLIQSTFLFSQALKDSTITLLFAGDIMGHDAQITSAYDSASGTYNYDDVFAPIKEILEKPDFSIANLELTLAGPPYKGYPQFSSPDALAMACKNNGIDVLLTANNHSCDRGLSGITRTISILDSLEIKHTGTFKNLDDRIRRNLLILENDFAKIGLLNYTYGTNGLPAPEPAIVNLINFDQMKEDIRIAKGKDLDEIIVILHWGLEYQTHPNDEQKNIVKFLNSEGINIIIGSHPHVLQRMEYHKAHEDQKEGLIVYSLGNFVSNQRKHKTDGGALVEITFQKKNGKLSIIDNGYHLIWVDKKRVGNEPKFEILPCSAVEKNQFSGLTKAAEIKMQSFIIDSREMLQKENINFPEKEFSF